MLPSVEELLVDEMDSLLKALERIDYNAQGICFVVNQEKELRGALTDGDIRRLILQGYSLETPVFKIMNTGIVSLPVDTDIRVIQNTISNKIRHIPLVDQQNRVVDYACNYRLHQIPVMEPLLDGNELEYVTDCIKSGWISSRGGYVKRFERLLADYISMPYGLAVSNGTSALHIALTALGIGKGDEVLVPNFTFAASINAIIHTGATPVLVDVKIETWTMDPDHAEKLVTASTKAIMPVHIYGHPCHMDELRLLAEAHNLFMVEDCAEALGSVYKGNRVGVFGHASCFSFFGNKTITTGEGGMVLFKDQAIYEKGKQLTNHGMSNTKRYWHDMVGYNYRMTNLQAAVGVAQMERLTQFLEKRSQIAQMYHSHIKELTYLQEQPIASWAKSSNWLYTVLLSDESPISRESLILKLMRNGIETRPVFYPLDTMPPYLGFGNGCEYEVSHDIGRRGISFPSSVLIGEHEINRIMGKVKELFDSSKQKWGDPINV